MRHSTFLFAGLLIASTFSPMAGAAPAPDAAPEPDKDKIIKLLIKEEIRDVVELYPFLVDRDTPSGTRREWAEQIFTPDAVMVARDPDGKILLTIHGRDQILARFGAEEKNPAISSRHLLTNTTFDEVTPDGAKTRTIAVDLSAVTAVGATRDRPRSTPDRASLFTYRDTWVRTDTGWRKSRSEIQFLN
ncbi:MAG: nuclear transport factor 2 family protein [Sphingobium sp.]